MLIIIITNKTYFTGEITLHVAQTVHTVQLQHVAQTVHTVQLQHCMYTRNLGCFRDIIVNTLHRGDNSVMMMMMKRVTKF
jgi:hypothetical protein